MKKIIKEEESVLACDVTGKELKEYHDSPHNQLGATIKLNNSYGCTFDGSKFHEIHISETVLKDILRMLEESYERETEFMEEVYELV